MTIDTFKGVVGLKVTTSDILRLFIKYNINSDVVSNVKKLCIQPFEKFFDLTDEEIKILISWGIKEAIKLAFLKEKNFDWGLNNEANT